MKVKEVLKALGLSNKDVTSENIHIPGNDKYVKQWQILDSNNRNSSTAYMFIPRVSKSQGFFTDRKNEVFEFYNMDADERHPTLTQLIEWRNDEMR